MFAATGYGSHFMEDAKQAAKNNLDRINNLDFTFKVVVFIVLQTIGVTLYISGMRAETNANALAITQLRDANSGIVKKVDDLGTQMNSIVVKETALDINVTNQGEILKTNSRVLDDINKNVENLTYGNSNGVTRHR